MIILDTSAVIDLFRGKGALRDYLDSEPAISVITVYEILIGVKYRQGRIEEKLFRQFFRETKVLNFDREAAESSAEIMGSLLKLGIPVNSLDVMIAGTALANGAEKIISKDKDFHNIAKVMDLDIHVY